MNITQRLKSGVFAGIFSVTGCVTLNLDDEFALSKRENEGMVWGKITGSAQFTDYQIHYLNYQTGEVGFIKATLVKICSAKGELFTVVLPEGRYTITG
ncbi:hypothetical protein L1286_20520 [Pseudoalteromonas sp. SMS1]|uniref:hypothetical protein n=1 Tax=Pseudoalteromonas sp. SMS1 TaxID=2908894 RepID=UPI001F460892|nr:hypothetical protein [Pseudoalteromonas sp. SMS1]MCF2859872.1 hypothetical protein [Pseudoalteromonas sp. SMS1]